MHKLKGFNFVAEQDAKILILGSMPGVESLKQQQYYAHPQNLFWHIMGNILDFEINISYNKKIEYLKAAKIALWDVIKKCSRNGSLDSNIRSVEVNDFISFFESHRKIKSVLFNGKKSEELFRKYVKNNLPENNINLKYYSMPSTSPANASISKNRKFEQWKILAVFVENALACGEKIPPNTSSQFNQILNY